jgi:hypothetical protein
MAGKAFEDEDEDEDEDDGNKNAFTPGKSENEGTHESRFAHANGLASSFSLTEKC